MKLSLFVFLFVFATTTHAQSLLPDSLVLDVPTQTEIEAAQQETKQLFPAQIKSFDSESAQRTLNHYSYIDPENLVPDDLLADALIFFDNNSGFTNRNFITIVDYSKPSWEQRLFIIRMSDGKVYPRHAGHGKNSDPDHNGYLDYYSNVSGSHKSSKGFYRTGAIYQSSLAGVGRAMRLHGLQSTNSNAFARGIVFHGSNNVIDERVIQGRSLGCVTISWTHKDAILDVLYDGSLMYVNNSDF